ncbi:MAG: hypothetical protein MJ252_03085 [archaeon]|nr:hypothetical protein [archaeon]
MCQCQRAFEPNPELEKSLVLLKIIGIINVLIAILHIYPMNSAGLMDIISCILILLAYNTLLFYYAQIYILLCCIDFIFMIDSIGVFFQRVFSPNSTVKTMSTSEYIALGINTFSLVFYIFAIFIVFKLYKEMRAQFYENAGVNFNNPQNSNNEYNGSEARAAWADNNINLPAANQRRNNNNANNNAEAPRGYVPFGGRGVAVGGH